MITTITLNPCTDRTVLLKNLTLGAHNRVDSVIQQISGKGINVSVVLKHLGFDTACLCFEYEKGGRAVREFLSGNDIDYAAVPVPGEMRLNLKLTDTVSSEMTEVNERGNRVPENAPENLLSVLSPLLHRTSILVADGSVPPGVPSDIYARMISLARDKGVKTVLDASGDLLKCGISAHPDVVKPNRFELETYYQTKLNSLDDAVLLCRRMIAEGAGSVCLSLGGDGAMLVTPGGAWYCAGSDVPVRGVQGAGDSMVAGLCAAMETNLSPADMLLYGVAAAQASLILPGTSLCEKKDFEEMLSVISVRKIG